ncbi:MAG: glycosyltransferase N-terminal domain-containing protein [Planctomycetota bacterium]
MLADLVYILLVLGLVLTWPFRHLRRRLSGRPAKRRAPVAERLGGFPSPPGEARSLWIHAVSVGEVLAARGLVARLAETWPELPIVVTTTTPAGLAEARRHFADHTVSYSPLDFSWVVRRAFRAFRPELLVLVELDLWPNQLRRARREGVPVVVVNGKLSERSARGFRRLRRLGLDPFDAIVRFLLQTERYRRRWLDVGLSAERLSVIGSLKVDNLPAAVPEGRGALLRRELGLEGRPVWLAGSTHEGEEAAVLRVHRNLRERHPELVLVIAPRHLERLPRVEELCAREGLPGRRRSATTGGGGEPVVLLDTMGELAGLFAGVDLVFLGGSLVPVGGHNVYEPAAAGRPQVVGPHVGTVAEAVADLAEVGALVEAADEGALERALEAWLLDPEAARAAGNAGREALDRARGATERTIEALRAVREGRSGAEARIGAPNRS